MTELELLEDLKPKSLHERMGITFAELGALYGLLGLIDNKLLKHTTQSDISDTDGSAHLFNMSTQLRKNTQCGSVGCIGGVIALIMGMDTDSAITYVGTGGRVGLASGAFQKLFFPDFAMTGDEINTALRSDIWNKITLEQAAKAIRNFIASEEANEPDWNLVLGRE